MIYTFYSYKGGIGRSMALVNIAELMCRDGWDVLMVDWDLEAPGLERFFFEEDELDQILSHPGVIDMLSDYKDNMLNFDPKNKTLLFPDIKKYMKSIDRKTGSGQLWLLPAGKRPEGQFFEYSDKVKIFDWYDFYKNWAGESYFEWLNQEFKKVAKFVLIDSRTGVTEIGGICTYQLADVVIMFCGANNQSIDGTLQI